MSTPIDLARTPDFSLGAAHVRPALRAFVAADGEHLLEPRVMQVLVALARAGGEVVSRDDLVAQCWGGRAVSEDAINRPIALLRKLGEASGAFAIETIARVGYRLAVQGGAPQRQAPPIAAAAPVLAVLAFDNLSADPDLTFFSDGVSDEILQSMSRAVKTIGRSSSFQFRGANKAVTKVAAELGATHVLDGSVRRAGGLVRVNAQLIEAASQTVSWRAQYERPAADLFAVQDEIATKVAGALNARLEPAPPAGAIDPVTYEAFLRAKERPASAAAIRARINTIDDITRAAPEFGPGWVEAFRVRGSARRNTTLSEAESHRLYSEMQTIEARATELVGASNAALTATVINWRPWAGAWTLCEARLRSALEGAPHASPVQQTLASLLLHSGRISEAVSLLRDLRELNALEVWSASLLAGALGALGQQDEEFALYEATCRRWPDSAMMWRNMVASAAYAGRFDIVDRWLTPVHAARFAQTNSGDVRAAQSTAENCRAPTDALREAILRRLHDRFESTGRVRLMNACHAAFFCDIAEVHDLVARADFSHVLDPLQGYEPGDYGAQILFQASSARFRSDPRFVLLCARLGLAKHWCETGRFPDCARATPYDFEAECARLRDTPLG